MIFKHILNTGHNDNNYNATINAAVVLKKQRSRSAASDSNRKTEVLKNFRFGKEVGNCNTYQRETSSISGKLSYTAS